MSSKFPPQPSYPLAIDSDRTLFLVYNTSEAKTTKESSAWQEEIEIEPVSEDSSEIWADNGFANISGELFYYDAVEKTSVSGTGAVLGNVKINEDGSLARISVLSGGSGYKKPSILVKGIGTGAKVDVIVENGSIIDVIILNPGVGYLGDDVSFEFQGKVFKLKRCARNLGGKKTKFNPVGTWVRGFVVAEHHNQLVNATLALEQYIFELEDNLARLENEPICPDDAYCPDVVLTTDTVEEETSDCGSITIEYEIIINGAFETFVLDFGDGQSTNSAQSGTHTYAPGAKVDPVVTVTSQNCTVVQTPLERPEGDVPEEPVEDTFILPIPEVPAFPDITLPEFAPTNPQIELPQIVFPCLDLNTPNISISIPPFISFIPPSFGPAPTITPTVTFGPAPTVPPATFTFGPAPTVPPATFEFGPAPTVPPATFEFGPAPTLPPATFEFGPAPIIDPVSFQFGPAPKVDGASFIFGPAPKVDGASFTFGPAPKVTGASFTFGPAPKVDGASFNWGTPPTVKGASFNWGTPPAVSGASFNWGTPPTVQGASFNWGSAPTIQASFNWGTPPTVQGASFNWGSPPTVPGGSFDWGSPPTVPGGSFNWGSPPSIGGSFDWGSPPSIGGSFDWGSPPSIGGSFDWGSPPSVGGASFDWGTPPSVGGASFDWGTPPTVEGTFDWGSPPSVGGGSFDWGTPPSVGGASFDWGTPPTVEGNFDWGTPPKIQTGTFEWGTPPAVGGSFDWGNPPEVKVTWDAPPTVSCVVTVECGGNSGTPYMKRGMSLDENFVDDFNTQNFDIEINDLGIPSEIKVVVPKFPEIKLRHDIPESIDLKSNLPDRIELYQSKELPKEIKITSDSLPDSIKIDAKEIPNSIKLDTSSLPGSISIVGMEIPSVISVDGSSIPDIIKVVGIPDSIEVKMPNEIIAKLQIPDDIEIPLVYKGDPVPIQFDTSNLLGTDDQACFALVPCNKK